MLRTAWILCALLLLPAAARAGDGHDRHERRDHRSAEDIEARSYELLRVADEELRALDSLVDAAASEGVRREIHKKAANLEGLLRELEGLTRDLADARRQPEVVEKIVVVEPPPPEVFEEPPPPEPCSARDFDRILKGIEGQSFSDEKLGVLRDAVLDRWFTVDQVKRVVGAFSFSKDKVDAAVLMYPRVVDPQDWYEVYEAFTFDSDKRDLRKRLGL